MAVKSVVDGNVVRPSVKYIPDIEGEADGEVVSDFDGDVSSIAGYVEVVTSADMGGASGDGEVLPVKPDAEISRILRGWVKWLRWRATTGISGHLEELLQQHDVCDLRCVTAHAGCAVLGEGLRVLESFYHASKENEWRDHEWRECLVARHGKLTAALMGLMAYADEIGEGDEKAFIVFNDVTRLIYWVMTGDNRDYHLIGGLIRKVITDTRGETLAEQMETLYAPKPMDDADYIRDKTSRLTFGGQTDGLDMSILGRIGEIYDTVKSAPSTEGIPEGVEQADSYVSVFRERNAKTVTEPQIALHKGETLTITLDENNVAHIASVPATIEQETGDVADPSASGTTPEPHKQVTATSPGTSQGTSPATATSQVTATATSPGTSPATSPGTATATSQVTATATSPATAMSPGTSPATSPGTATVTSQVTATATSPVSSPSNRPKIAATFPTSVSPSTEPPDVHSIYVFLTKVFVPYLFVIMSHEATNNYNLEEDIGPTAGMIAGTYKRSRYTTRDADLYDAKKTYDGANVQGVPQGLRDACIAYIEEMILVARDTTRKFEVESDKGGLAPECAKSLQLVVNSRLFDALKDCNPTVAYDTREAWWIIDWQYMAMACFPCKEDLGCDDNEWHARTSKKITTLATQYEEAAKTQPGTSTSTPTAKMEIIGAAVATLKLMLNDPIEALRREKSVSLLGEATRGGYATVEDMLLSTHIFTAYSRNGLSCTRSKTSRHSLTNVGEYTTVNIDRPDDFTVFTCSCLSSSVGLDIQSAEARRALLKEVYKQLTTFHPELPMYSAGTGACSLPKNKSDLISFMYYTSEKKRLRLNAYEDLPETEPDTGLCLNDYLYALMNICLRIQAVPIEPPPMCYIDPHDPHADTIYKRWNAVAQLRSDMIVGDIVKDQAETHYYSSPDRADLSTRLLTRWLDRSTIACMNGGSYGIFQIDHLLYYIHREMRYDVDAADTSKKDLEPHEIDGYDFISADLEKSIDNDRDKLLVGLLKRKPQPSKSRPSKNIVLKETEWATKMFFAIYTLEAIKRMKRQNDAQNYMYIPFLMDPYLVYPDLYERMSEIYTKNYTGNWDDRSSLVKAYLDLMDAISKEIILKSQEEKPVVIQLDTDHFREQIDEPSDQTDESSDDSLSDLYLTASPKNKAYLEGEHDKTLPYSPASNTRAANTVGAATNAVSTATNAVGSTTNTVGSTTNTVGTASNTVGSTTNTVGSTTNTVGSTTNTVGSTTNTVGTATNAVGTATNAVGAAANAVGAATNAVGTATNAVGTATNAVGAAANTVGAAANTVGAAANTVGAAANTVGTATNTVEDAAIETMKKLLNEQRATDIQKLKDSTIAALKEANEKRDAEQRGKALALAERNKEEAKLTQEQLKQKEEARNLANERTADVGNALDKEATEEDKRKAKNEKYKQMVKTFGLPIAGVVGIVGIVTGISLG